MWEKGPLERRAISELAEPLARRTGLRAVCERDGGRLDILVREDGSWSWSVARLPDGQIRIEPEGELREEEYGEECEPDIPRCGEHNAQGRGGPAPEMG